jgi:hypothetical protein
MDKSILARQAQEFSEQLKTALLRQIHELNLYNNGELQDGFNPLQIDDGWVSLKGYSWGFVMLYDHPVRIDTTCGPDWPFTGYRTTYLAKPASSGIAFANSLDNREIYHSADDLARAGLRRLADKVGDGWIFEAQVPQQITVWHGPYGEDLLPEL